MCGLLGTQRRLKRELVDARPVATVHDSIELLCHKDHISKCLEIVYDELVNYPFMKEKFNIHFDVPLKIDAEVGHSFGDGIEVDFKNGKPQNLREVREYMND